MTCASSLQARKVMYTNLDTLKYLSWRDSSSESGEWCIVLLMRRLARYVISAESDTSSNELHERIQKKAKREETTQRFEMKKQQKNWYVIL